MVILILYPKKSNSLQDNSNPNQEFSKMMNTVAQKTNQIKNSNKTSSKSKTRKELIHNNDDNDDNNEVDDEFMKGLKMMEDDLLQKGDIEPMDEDGDDNYYNEIKKETQHKKQSRKEKYKVEPKYPKLQTLITNEGERAASRAILKNRGLVAHKNKLNRNPRVKKREQYRKALIKRRGAVRDVINGEDSMSYGGEKSGLSLIHI